ncbi:MAG: alpha/beta hydrolase [Actinomycetota bacterium]
MAVTRDLVTLTTRDGLEMDALLHVDDRMARVRERRTGRRTAIVHVHGIMGNFLVGTLRFLPAPLAREGYPTLVIETRLANVGQLFGQGMFADALLDLDAATRWLRDQGYDELILSGYSSGATLVTLHAATHPVPWCRGLLCLGNPWGLPQAAERRCERFGAEPDYWQLAAGVRARLDDHPDHIFVVRRSRGPTRKPRDSEVYTGRTWWHSRGPEAVEAMACRQIGKVPHPLLLVQGTADWVVEPWEASELARVAREAGNDDVTVEWVEGADHSFEGHEMTTLAAVTRWLHRVA